MSVWEFYKTILGYNRSTVLEICLLHLTHSLMPLLRQPIRSRGQLQRSTQRPISKCGAGRMVRVTYRGINPLCIDIYIQVRMHYFLMTTQHKYVTYH